MFVVVFLKGRISNTLNPIVFVKTHPRKRMWLAEKLASSKQGN